MNVTGKAIVPDLAAGDCASGTLLQETIQAHQPAPTAKLLIWCANKLQPGLQGHLRLMMDNVLLNLGDFKVIVGTLEQLQCTKTQALSRVPQWNLRWSTSKHTMGPGSTSWGIQAQDYHLYFLQV